MSQRKWYQGKKEILTGWDRPLQNYFITILDQIPNELLGESEEEVVLDWWGLDLDQALEELRNEEIKIPDGLREALQEDRAKNDMTTVMVYNSRSIELLKSYRDEEFESEEL